MNTCKDCPYKSTKTKVERVRNYHGVTEVTVHYPYCTLRKRVVTPLMRCPVVDNPTKYMKRESAPEITYIED